MGPGAEARQSGIAGPKHFIYKSCEYQYPQTTIHNVIT